MFFFYSSVLDASHLMMMMMGAN